MAARRRSTRGEHLESDDEDPRLNVLGLMSDLVDTSSGGPRGNYLRPVKKDKGYSELRKSLRNLMTTIDDFMRGFNFGNERETQAIQLTDSSVLLEMEGDMRDVLGDEAINRMANLSGTEREQAIESLRGQADSFKKTLRELMGKDQPLSDAAADLDAESL